MGCRLSSQNTDQGRLPALEAKQNKISTGARKGSSSARMAKPRTRLSSAVAPESVDREKRHSASSAIQKKREGSSSSWVNLKVDTPNTTLAMPSTRDGVDSINTVNTFSSEGQSRGGAATNSCGRNSILSNDVDQWLLNGEPPLRVIDNIRDDYEISEDSSIEVLGRGGFGEVFIARDRKTGKDVAVKRLMSSRGSSANSSEYGLLEAYKEASMLKRVKGHPHVVEILDHVQVDGNVYIVMEHCSGGDLMKYVLQCEHFSEKVASYLFRQIVLAISHCHKHSVVHRDLKPDNILFSGREGKAELKLCDFGLAETLTESTPYLKDTVGSCFFIAPEVLKHKYNQNCDNWALGVILYLLLSGAIPFGSIASKPKDVQQAIHEQPLTFSSPTWRTISASAKELVAGLLEKNENKRYTAEQILRHPWVTGDAVSDEPLEKNVMDRMCTFDKQNKLRRETVRLVTSTLSAADIQLLRSQFHAIDSDADMTLDSAELAQAFQKSGMSLDAEAVEELVKKLDLNGDGVIDMEEFMMATADLQMRFHQNKIWWAFNQYDADHDGQITVEELRGIFDEDDDQQLKEYIAAYDVDKDGTIDYEEFMQMLLPG